MAENKNSYWGWEDIADLPEAIIFYGEMVSRGHHHHEICKMLDSYFPRIDKITCKKIRFKAFKWLKTLATDIETKIYLAKSMVRLERICANEHEKTKNVLAADAQLSHLLGLANIQEKDGPEELAAKMRAFLLGAQAATDGTAAEKAAEACKSDNIDEELQKAEKNTEAENTPASTTSQDTEEVSAAPELIEPALSPKEQKAAQKQEKDDEKAIDFLLRVSRAKRLKKDISKLEEEGIRDGDNKDDWDGEVDA